VPGQGWVASDYIAIDQGPILAMIANYRNDFVWNVMKRNPHIRRGLERAGFTGGWLAPEDGPRTSGEPDIEAANAEDIDRAQRRMPVEDEERRAEPRASEPPQ
jgi:hypothetical protein